MFVLMEILCEDKFLHFSIFGSIKREKIIEKIFLNFFYLARHVLPFKGRQWAGSGQPGPFLLGPWAQWARHNELLTS